MKDEDIDREKTTQEIDIPAYLGSFSAFGVLDVGLPPGFSDLSNSSEVCPRFENSGAGIGVWINFRRIEDRRGHVKDKPRFWVYIKRDQDGNPVAENPGKIVFESDDWGEVLGFMESYL